MRLGSGAGCQGFTTAPASDSSQSATGAQPLLPIRRLEAHVQLGGCCRGWRSPSTKGWSCRHDAQAGGRGQSLVGGGCRAGGWQAPAQEVPPHSRSPAVPLCLLPTFLDPPCAPLIRLPMNFPGKDLVSHAKAPCCLASIWLRLAWGRCAQPHRRQPSRSVLVPARGQGWGQPGPSSWQERGRPVASPWPEAGAAGGRSMH